MSRLFKYEYLSQALVNCIDFTLSFHLSQIFFFFVAWQDIRVNVDLLIKGKERSWRLCPLFKNEMMSVLQRSFKAVERCKAALNFVSLGLNGEGSNSLICVPNCIRNKMITCTSFTRTGCGLIQHEQRTNGTARHAPRHDTWKYSCCSHRTSIVNV